MPDALVVASLAGLAALSLLLGAAISIVWRPTARVVAIVMAFGSGALIHAVVTELASNPATALVREQGLDAVSSWLIIATGFFIGGLTYIGVNLVVERFGGGIHRRKRVSSRALATKRARLAPILQALAGSEIASLLAPEEVEAVLPFLHAVTVSPGAVIFRPGAPSDALYIVQQGVFTVLHDGNENDPPSACTTLGPGEVVGGLGMIGGEPRTATFSTGDGGVLLVLTRTDFDHVLSANRRLRSTVTGMVARQLIASAQARGRADPSEWYRTAVGSLEHLTHAEAVAAAKHTAAAGSPFAIFIGALQDGIPESIAIGASFTGLAVFNSTFLVAVLLSNLPEAMSGTAALMRAGFSTTRVLLLWLGLVAGSAVAGALGYAILRDAGPPTIVLLGALAGGGVVAMLATTMMPEAFEAGGSGVAPATIAGFLASLLLSLLQLQRH